jgi:hypothetical protein
MGFSVMLFTMLFTGEVQLSLKMDVVLWKRGLLVMPKIVRDILLAMEVGRCRFSLARWLFCRLSGLS